MPTIFNGEQIYKTCRLEKQTNRIYIEDGQDKRTTCYFIKKVGDRKQILTHPENIKVAIKISLMSTRGCIPYIYYKLVSCIFPGEGEQPLLDSSTENNAQYGTCSNSPVADQILVY
ncbi:hypothetical protein TNCV_954741 [Trichonephila clavipes]|nr:hypothetical protein TNCV_954741 [Trichonephila clavipes]